MEGNFFSTPPTAKNKLPCYLEVFTNMYLFNFLCFAIVTNLNLEASSSFILKHILKTHF